MFQNRYHWFCYCYHGSDDGDGDDGDDDDGDDGDDYYYFCRWAEAEEEGGVGVGWRFLSFFSNKVKTIAR